MGLWAKQAAEKLLMAVTAFYLDLIYPMTMRGDDLCGRKKLQGWGTERL
jgi:hypothetical protein